jgi:hypothetical protein
VRAVHRAIDDTEAHPEACQAGGKRQPGRTGADDQNIERPFIG